MQDRKRHAPTSTRPRLDAPGLDGGELVDAYEWLRRPVHTVRTRARELRDTQPISRQAIQQAFAAAMAS